MRILGVETSCDETAISVIEISGSRAKPRIKVLSNIVSSQAKLHAKFGGVVPNLAKREHQRNLVPVLLMALKEAKLRSPKYQTRNPKQIQNPKSKILNSILEREPELLAEVEKKILPLRPPKVDAIAVTVGPGLAPALWVGVNFARTLAYLWDKPIIPVNHLEGHVYTNLLPQIRKTRNLKYGHAVPYSLSSITFPALCLVVSGGHTELVLMRGYGKYRIIGETLDDAAGEAFDKVAKMLRLGFPGGPEIAAEAAKVQNDATCHLERKRGISRDPSSASRLQDDTRRIQEFQIKLPRPMINSGNFDFSFSGLKTAVLYLLRDLKGKYPLSKIRPAVANEFQQAVVDVLVSKTIGAAKKFKVKTVMIGGGVAANRKLRAELGEALKLSFPNTCYLLPNSSLTGDNALMIALAGWFNRQKKKAWRSLRAVSNLRLTPP